MKRLIGLVVLTAASCLPLLLKYPAPGGDEPGFVDVAYSVAARGVLATDAYRALLPGAEHHIYWQPPLYFLALGGWFRAAGAGLTAARLFSFLWAIVAVLLLYLTARRTIPKRPATIAAGLYAVSFFLTNRAAVARMDMMCIALTLAAVFSYLVARDRDSDALHGLSGLTAGLALTTHPLGVIAIATLLLHEAIEAGPAIVRRRRTGLLLGGFAIAAGAWGIYIAQDPATFAAQMGKQLERKAQLGSYWQQFWMVKTHAVTLLVACGAGLWVVARSWKDRTHAVVAVACVTSFVVATFGRETGYFSYFFPFACLAVGVALAYEGRRRAALAAAVALAFLNESAILANDIRRYRRRDHAALTRVVRDAIPPGASVFIAHPQVTPYFALLGRNPMRIAVPTSTGPNAHRDAALASDFIAVTTPLAYLPEVGELVRGHTPAALVDQGPGYRLEIYRSPGAKAD